jgi:hypothetical protein
MLEALYALNTLVKLAMAKRKADRSNPAEKLPKKAKVGRPRSLPDLY